MVQVGQNRRLSTSHPANICPWNRIKELGAAFDLSRRSSKHTLNSNMNNKGSSHPKAPTNNPSTVRKMPTSGSSANANGSASPQVATTSSHANDFSGSPNTANGGRDGTLQEGLAPKRKRKPSEETHECPDIVEATLRNTAECKFTATIAMWEKNAPRDSMDSDEPQKRWSNKLFANLSSKSQEKRQSLVDSIQSVTGPSVPYWVCVPVKRRQKQMPNNPLNCSSFLLWTIVKCLKEMDYLAENNDELSQPLNAQGSTSPLPSRGTGLPQSTARARRQAEEITETVEQGPSSRATSNASLGVDNTLQQHEGPEDDNDRLEFSRQATPLTPPLRPEVNERSRKRRRMDIAKKELEIAQANVEIARLQYEMEDD